VLAVHRPVHIDGLRPSSAGIPGALHALPDEWCSPARRWDDHVRMTDHIVAWLLRALWVGMPFAAWPAISTGLRSEPGAVQTAAAVGAWVMWAGILIATFVPVPATLTAIRAIAPAVLGAVIGAAATERPSTAALAFGVGWSALLSAVVFLPQTATVCVNGPAYANERRFPLAPPGPLLLGPLEVASALVIGLPTAGVLLLVAERWLLGAVLTVVGFPMSALLARALHGLSRRWFVFVPAGVVVHDPMALADPVLFPREVIEYLAPGRGGVDLTLGAYRMALELRLREEAELEVLHNRRRKEVATRALLIAPTMPGRVLAYAAGHRIPVAVPQPAVPATKAAPP